MTLNAFKSNQRKAPFSSGKQQESSRTSYASLIGTQTLDGGSGPVHDFLRSHLADEFTSSVTALGEFAAGFADTADQVFLAIKSRFRLRPMDETEAGHYREIFRFLKERGELIGGMIPMICSSLNLLLFIGSASLSVAAFYV
jgi:hypothetical protein